MDRPNASSEECVGPNRVVSLLGAATETIYRLGLGEKLVGRSHECDYPPACLKLPCISRPRMDPDALSSLEIDNAVRSFAAKDEPVYKLQDQTLLDLKPDMLIAQDHCRVCAVTQSDIKESEACHKIPQLVLKPSTLEHCLDDVLKVADALGYSERGRRLYQSLNARMNRAKELGDQLLETEKQSRVALLEWCDPVMGCGYWLPELVSIAGGTPIFSTPVGGATPTITFDSLLEAKPDVIVLALCGFSIARTSIEIRRVWSQEQMHQLLQICPVYITDGNFLFNRSGPRVVESAEVLLEAIHRSMRGHFGHFGTKFLVTLQDALDLQDMDSNDGKNRPPVRENVGSSTNLPSIPNPPAPASEMVAQQLLYLRTDDFPCAFAYNSIANQNRWCNPKQFISVLKSHNDFKEILIEEPLLIEETSSPSNGIVRVKVANGRILVWTCVVETAEEGSVWRTERVGIE